MYREPVPIDFTWVIFMGMNRLGFTKSQVEKMYFGEWQDFFEVYKKVYNFETSKQLYCDEAENEEKIGSIDDL